MLIIIRVDGRKVVLVTRKVARKLRELREINNLTQTQVAEALYVSRQAVSSWELGNTMPSIESCIMLLDLYDTTLEEMLCLNRKGEISDEY